MSDAEAATEGTDRTVYVRLSSWSVHVHFWTRHRHPRLHVMQYERMVEAPEEAFGAVLRYLGHEPAAARLEQAVRFSSCTILQEQERTAGFSERPQGADAPFFRVGQSGQWRQALTARQRLRIEHDHREMMARLGYIGAV